MSGAGNKREEPIMPWKEMRSISTKAAPQARIANEQGLKGLRMANKYYLTLSNVSLRDILTYRYGYGIYIHNLFALHMLIAI